MKVVVCEYIVMSCVWELCCGLFEGRAVCGLCCMWVIWCEGCMGVIYIEVVLGVFE